MFKLNLTKIEGSQLNVNIEKTQIGGDLIINNSVIENFEIDYNDISEISRYAHTYEGYTYNYVSFALNDGTSFLINEDIKEVQTQIEDGATQVFEETLKFSHAVGQEMEEEELEEEDTLTDTDEDMAA